MRRRNAPPRRKSPNRSRYRDGGRPGEQDVRLAKVKIQRWREAGRAGCEDLRRSRYRDGGRPGEQDVRLAIAT